LIDPLSIILFQCLAIKLIDFGFSRKNIKSTCVVYTSFTSKRSLYIKC
jgi:hypothetical protein